LERDLYGVARWGKDYLTILPNGHIGLKNPMHPTSEPTDLVSVVESLSQRGISSPLLLRVEELLGHRLALINSCFQQAIETLEYENYFRGVFPVKVNQQAQVIDRIVSYGRPYHFGLEVGSKPELLIALAHQLSSESVIICNGIKDAEFIRLALLSLRLGFKTIIVLESPKELELVLNEAEDLQIRPYLGIRIKLTHKMSGKWSTSSGDRSSFGMTTSQVMSVIDELREHKYLDCLILQHSHLGSQLPHIIEIRHAVREACNFYAALIKEGAPLGYLDIGGGLGVDYTGEHKSKQNSINYSLEEYCTNVIETIKFTLDEVDIAHPVVITESGRACVAHSSMLIFNVLEVSRYDSSEPIFYKAGEDHELVSHILEVLNYLSEDRLQECLNDLTYYQGELRVLFRRSQLTLRQIARGENAFLYVLSKLKALAVLMEDLNEELQTALDSMADIYHCNFSLFQSLPDVWAIDQVHPITPLQRLNEHPTRYGTLSDITCDSDGKIDRFVLADGVSNTLPLHPIKPNETYYLGVFFVGAYQETLGDLHNLFGDTNVVTIALGTDGGFELLHEQEGDSIAEVLSYVEYEPKLMLNDFKKIIEVALNKKLIGPHDRRILIDAYKDSMTGYTYYED
jgi:arginine decarboxylase